MEYDEQGSLTPGDFDSIVAKLPVLSELNLSLSVVSFLPPIDSSNVTVEHWAKMAETIKENYDQYEGFLVLHGTDTMAYSASALSFMLKGLSKPVVFTGAQLPIASPRSDARENFITALEIASDYKEGRPMVPEVSIYFNHLLIRGNRSKKVESNHFDAFESENYPILAEAGISIDYQRNAIMKPVDESVSFGINTKMDTSVIILKLFPGITANAVESILMTDHVRGVVLESYGSGNVPNRPWFLDLLKKSLDSGKVIINISQCNGGQVAQGKYEASSALDALGVVNGSDLTTEAAVTKMMHCLAQHKSTAEVKSALISPIAGEMTPVTK